MPTYEYECADCGPFSEVRPMAEFDQPQPCPDCTTPAPRLLTAPSLVAALRKPIPERRQHRPTQAVARAARRDGCRPRRSNYC
jgi:putative FmdB family regulatory protein